MDDGMDHEESDGRESELGCRPPGDDDLIALCRQLNALGANYIVVGGFAVIHAGYGRFTRGTLMMTGNPSAIRSPR